MNREKLIETIKKLLALSDDASTTEHEKNLALNRAKEMMAQHCIEEYDIRNVRVNDLIVSEEYTPTLDNPLPSYLFNPGLMNTILQPICNNFGCYCSFYLSKSTQAIMGFKINIEVAKYACDVLLNAGIKDFRREYKKTRSIGFAVTFWNGFAEGVATRFTKLSNETAVVLYDKVRDKFTSSIKMVQLERPQSTEHSGFEIGKKSATEAQLNPTISTAHGRQLK